MGVQNVNGRLIRWFLGKEVAGSGRGRLRAPRSRFLKLIEAASHFAALAPSLGMAVGWVGEGDCVRREAACRQLKRRQHEGSVEKRSPILRSARMEACSCSARRREGNYSQG